MSAHYLDVVDLQWGVSLWVDFETARGKVIDYTVILLLATTEGTRTIRVYDGAHGYNEMHRYTKTIGKQTGERFHSGTLSEGLQAAISEGRRSYLPMIEGWHDD